MELGSEYNLSLSALNIQENNLFSHLAGYSCVYTDSGRSALKLISKTVRGEILLPEFICGSVINCFDKEKIKFYQVDAGGQIDIDDLLSKVTRQTEAILVMHYWGALQCEESLMKIRDIAGKQGILIIEDTTQSIFTSSGAIGDYMIASVRKWMPIALGGVLYTQRKPLPDVAKFAKSCDNERLLGMLLKDMFLKDVFGCSETYMAIFRACEKRLDNKEEIKLLSDLSRFIISCIDVRTAAARRRKNYNYLANKLGEFGIEPVCALAESDCPFVYPLRVRERNKFRQYLIDNKIYCAVHWPFDGFKPQDRKRAVFNADTLISLPIDQRYGENEMDYLAETIKRYGGALSF